MLFDFAPVIACAKFLSKLCLVCLSFSFNLICIIEVIVLKALQLLLPSNSILVFLVLSFQAKMNTTMVEIK